MATVGQKQGFGVVIDPKALEQSVNDKKRDIETRRQTIHQRALSEMQEVGTMYGAMDIFNRLNLANASGSFTSANFGRSTTTVGDNAGAPGIGSGEPFNMQFAAKVIF